MNQIRRVRSVKISVSELHIVIPIRLALIDDSTALGPAGWIGSKIGDGLAPIVDGFREGRQDGTEFLPVDQIGRSRKAQTGGCAIVGRVG